MALEAIDLKALDPGVRAFVSFLRARGFNTTDSGDGVSKLSLDTAEVDTDVLPWAHVFIRIPPSKLLEEADRLADAMKSAGIELEAGDIQASYDPLQMDVAVIALIDDGDRYIRSFAWRS